MLWLRSPFSKGDFSLTHPGEDGGSKQRPLIIFSPGEKVTRRERNVSPLRVWPQIELKESQLRCHMGEVCGWFWPFLLLSFLVGPSSGASSLSPCQSIESPPSFLPQPFLPFFPAPEQPSLCCSKPRCGKRTTQVSLSSGGSAANWIVKDDPAAQLPAKLGPSDTR